MIKWKQYIKEFKSKLESMYNIMRIKNSDYASEDNPFRNLMMVEKLWLSSTEKWILIRMVDKISRVSNLLNKKNKVKDESIEDTLLDLANYSLILSIYIKNKE